MSRFHLNFPSLKTGAVHALRYFFRIDAPIVYFGSTILPSRIRPA
jgi:hypothetical protein